MSNERTRSILHSDNGNASLPRHNQSAISTSQPSPPDCNDGLATQNPIISSASCAIREATVVHSTETRANTCNNLSRNARRCENHGSREGKLTLARSQKRKKIDMNLNVTMLSWTRMDRPVCF